jgi:hypothetical protein
MFDPMSYLVERLADPRRHLRHRRDLRPRITSSAAIEQSFPSELVSRTNEYPASALSSSPNT